MWCLWRDQLPHFHIDLLSSSVLTGLRSLPTSPPLYKKSTYFPKRKYAHLAHHASRTGSGLATNVCRKITGQLTSAIAQQEDVAVQLEALDILSDMLSR